MLIYRDNFNDLDELIDTDSDDEYDINLIRNYCLFYYLYDKKE